MTMAIPFTLPSDQETEENYRRLNQLLIDLYEVIQILIRPPRPQVPGARMRRGDEEGGTNRPSVHSSVQNSANFESTTRQPETAPQMVPSSIPARVEPSSTVPTAEQGLPDLVLSSVAPSNGSQISRKVLPPRRQRRKLNKAEKRHSTRPSHSINLAFGMEHHASSSSYHQVSNREFSSPEGEESLSSETKSIKVKASSLVSLLVPASFSGQIWTTLIIIVGWKLLARQR